MIDINDLRQVKSMADRLSAYISDMIAAESVPSIAPAKPAFLCVPYRSQWDIDANKYNSDCGPTSVAMVLEYFGTHVDINQVAIAANEAAHPNYTMPDDLIAAAAKYGVKLQRAFNVTIDLLRIETMEKSRPVIALVHYGALTSLVQDQRFISGHWLVVIGIDAQNVYVNDPNWRDERRSDGANLSIPCERFQQALADCRLDGNTPNQALLVIPNATTI